MTPLQIFGIVIGVIALLIIIHLCITLVAATITFVTTLVRRNKKKWDRNLHFKVEPQITMDGIGIEWMKENIQYRLEESIL